jgi:hypothetical protein
MKRVIFLFGWISLFLMTTPGLKAQENATVANKTIYGSLGGPGLLMSAHFDSRFQGGERLGLGYTLGVGFAFASFDETTSSSYSDGDLYSDSRVRSFYSIPVGLNYIFGKNNSAHTFELGGGAALLTRKISLAYNSGDKPGRFIGYLSFAYRIMPIHGGFAFRVGLSPVIGTSGDLFPFPVVGFGYAF